MKVTIYFVNIGEPYVSQIFSQISELAKKVIGDNNYTLSFDGPRPEYGYIISPCYAPVLAYKISKVIIESDTATPCQWVVLIKRILSSIPKLSTDEDVIVEYEVPIKCVDKDLLAMSRGESWRCYEVVNDRMVYRSGFRILSPQEIAAMIRYCHKDYSNKSREEMDKILTKLYREGCSEYEQVLHV